MTVRIRPTIDLPWEIELASLSSMAVSMGCEIAFLDSLGGRDNSESQGSFRPPTLPSSAISGEVDPRRTWWLNPRVDNPHFPA